LGKYISEDISLTWIANHLNISTAHLSEIIKIYRNKTFSNYINSLKINYIIHKLVTDSAYREYTTDLLAGKCGYSSRKNFAASFKNETGITPSYFIDKLKKDNLYLDL